MKTYSNLHHSPIIPIQRSMIHKLSPKDSQTALSLPSPNPLRALTNRSKNPISHSPVPIMLFRTRNPTPKADIFKNPSACYLSRKQLSFIKPSPNPTPNSSPTRFETPVKSKGHQKNRSQQISSSDEGSSQRVPISLLPIDSFKRVSTGIKKNQSEYLKAVQCDVLKSIAKYCDNSMINSKKIKKSRKSAMVKYAKDVTWLASITKAYNQYQPNIAKALVLFSDHSRNEFDKERKNIVSLIKSGDFDPNLSVFKLKAIRKRTGELF